MTGAFKIVSLSGPLLSARSCLLDHAHSGTDLAHRVYETLEFDNSTALIMGSRLATTRSGVASVPALVPHDQDHHHRSESRHSRTKPSQRVNPFAGSRPQSAIKLPPRLRYERHLKFLEFVFPQVTADQKPRRIIAAECPLPCNSPAP